MAGDSVARFAEGMTSLSSAIEASGRVAVGRAALALTREVRGQIRIASGGDNRLSGVGKRGARVGAKYDVKGSRNATALVQATGPLALIEFGNTTGGFRGGGRRGRGKGRRVVAFGGGVYSRTRGRTTSGKYPFRDGVRAGRGPALEAFAIVTRQTIRRELGI